MYNKIGDLELFYNKYKIKSCLKIVLPYDLPTMNTYTLRNRMGFSIGNASKKIAENKIFRYLEDSNLNPQIYKIEPPYIVHFKFFVNNRKKDRDNISSTKKFILDALIKAQIIEKDKWDYYLGSIEEFFLDRTSPRTEVYIYSIENYNPDDEVFDGSCEYLVGKPIKKRRKQKNKKE